MNYEVEGKFTVEVMVTVHADNEEAAKLLAINAIREGYNLDLHGHYHSVANGVKFDLDVFDVEEDE